MEIKRTYLNTKYKLPNADTTNAFITSYIPDTIDCSYFVTEKRNNILILPGGAYLNCSEREAEPIALKFLPYGYNVFVLEYSCKPATFPQQIIEVAAALQYIKDTEKENRAEGMKTAIMGFSAGGHLATFYSNMYYSKEVSEFFPNAIRPDAVVVGYPVIVAYLPNHHMSSFKFLVGKEALSPEEQLFFSVDKHVTPDTPPTFIWHTATDQTVNALNSLIYAQALNENKVPYALHVYPFGKHGLATCDNLTDNDMNEKTSLAFSWMNEANEWLKVIFSL